MLEVKVVDTFCLSAWFAQVAGNDPLKMRKKAQGNAHLPEISSQKLQNMFCLSAIVNPVFGSKTITRNRAKNKAKRMMDHMRWSAKICVFKNTGVKEHAFC